MKEGRLDNEIRQLMEEEVNKFSKAIHHMDDWGEVMENRKLGRKIPKNSVKRVNYHPLKQVACKNHLLSGWG